MGKKFKIVNKNLSYFYQRECKKNTKKTHGSNFLRDNVCERMFEVEFLGDGAKAGATFDNSFFDNYFDFLRQLKNGSFLGPVFVHVTGRS